MKIVPFKPRQLAYRTDVWNILSPEHLRTYKDLSVSFYLCDGTGDNGSRCIFAYNDLSRNPKDIVKNNVPWFTKELVDEMEAIVKFIRTL